MSSTKPSNDPVASCSLSTRQLAERARQFSRIAGDAGAVEERDDGLMLVFPPSDETATRLLELVLAERRCCPFFHFELVFEPHPGPLRVLLRGPAGTRSLVRGLLSDGGELTPPSPAARRGLPARPARRWGG